MPTGGRVNDTGGAAATGGTAETGGAVANTGETSGPGLLPKHWHESSGFGTDTEGGLGGEVYKVTNLNNSGAGSLRDAISSDNRLVVFEVGGVINLEGDHLEIGGSGITVAGQTAPSPGITLVRGALEVSGSDVVVSHISTRLGTEVDGNPDAADITGDNIVFDHVAVSWSIDECLSITGANNVTLFKTMVTEALSNATHSEGEHSKGSLIQKGTSNLSLINTLYAHNALRNPRLHSGAQAAMINDVIYNWFPGADDEGDTRFHFIIHMNDASMSIVGNTAIQGPDSVGEILVHGHKSGSGDAYMKDNIIVDRVGTPLQEYDPDSITPLDSPPLWPEGVEVAPTDESLYEVLRTVGPRPGDRDTVNARVVGTVATGTGQIVNNQEDVGGYPTFAQTTHSVTVPDGVEERRAWLDELEDAMAVDRGIDLSRLYGLVGSEASDRLR